MYYYLLYDDVHSCILSAVTIKMMMMMTMCVYIRISSLQQQLDDAVKEIDEMKAARKRQAEMVIAIYDVYHFCLCYELLTVAQFLFSDKCLNIDGITR